MSSKVNPKSQDELLEEERGFTDVLFGDIDEKVTTKKEKKEITEKKERKPLWHDPDDDEIDINLHSNYRTRRMAESKNEASISGTEYSSRLRKHIASTSEIDSLFALPEETVPENDIDSLLRSSKRFVGKSKTIRPDHLEIQKLSSINMCEDSGEGRSTGKEMFKNNVKYLSFHSAKNILLALNKSNCVHLYDINDADAKCRKILHLDNFEINSVNWTSEKTILLSSKNRQFLMYYDMERDKYSSIFNIPGFQEMAGSTIHVTPDGTHALLLGSEGSIFEIDLRTRRTDEVRRLSSPIRDACFYDNSTCYILTQDSHVVEYDIKAGTVINNYWDSNQFGATRLCINGNYMGVGDQSGILSVYHTPTTTNTTASTIDGEPRTITPLKSYKNLTTRISNIAINNDNSLLVYSAKDKKDSLRVVHLPTQSVYSNWPTAGTPLGFVYSLAMSNDNQYLAVGSKKGTIGLYRFNHFYKWSVG